MRATWLAWLLCMAFAASASAQSGRDKQRTIVFVMESAGGLRAAAELRKSLNDTGCQVISLAEAQRRSLEPDALITVASDPSRSVQVRYWDRDGRSDVLSAAAPATATADQMAAIALALSSALVDRHRFDRVEGMSTIAADIRNRAGMFDARQSQAIYAMLGHLGRLTPRTNVQLRFEDF